MIFDRVPEAFFKALEKAFVMGLPIERLPGFSLEQLINYGLLFHSVRKTWNVNTRKMPQRIPIK